MLNAVYFSQEPQRSGVVASAKYYNALGSRTCFVKKRELFHYGMNSIAALTRG